MQEPDKVYAGKFVGLTRLERGYWSLKTELSFHADTPRCSILHKKGIEAGADEVLAVVRIPPGSKLRDLSFRYSDLAVALANSREDGD